MMKLPSNDESFDDEDTHSLMITRNSEYAQYTRPKRNPVVNCVVTAFAYLQFFWIHHRTESILAIVLFSAVSLAVTGVIETYENGAHNPRMHTIAHDYSEIKSELELKLGTIDHWCLDGGDSHCPRCEDPTKPTPRLESKWWGEVFNRNTKLSKHFLEDYGDVDVIFLGDSNTEARAGTFKGEAGAGSATEEKVGEVVLGTLENTLRKSKNKFDKYFKKSAGGKYNGLALGIAGDTSPNLLWRIQQNEFRDLQPKVWWISIGVNDLLSTYCSEETTLMGVLRIVEELLHRNDGSTIVINSILPVAVRSSLSLEGKHIHNKYWPAIKLVNERLKKFAKKHPGVKFFNADDILTDNHGANKYMKKEMFVDKVHLSADGQEALAEAQADEIAAIYQKKADVKSGNGDSASGTANTDANSNAESSEEPEPQYSGNDDLYGYALDDFVDDWFTNGN